MDYSIEVREGKVFGEKKTLKLYPYLTADVKNLGGKAMMLLS